MNCLKEARVILSFDTNHHELYLLFRALNYANYRYIDYRFLAVGSPPDTTRSLIEDSGIPEDLVYFDPDAEAASALLYVCLPGTLFLNTENVLIKNRSSMVRPEFLESDLNSIQD